MAAVVPCLGNAEDHCCYVAGAPCRLLRDDGPDAARRWVCTLRERHGNWDDVTADPAYRPIGDRWVTIGAPFDYCATFSAPCAACKGGVTVG